GPLLLLRLAPGEALDLTGVAAPTREGLTFVRWEDGWGIEYGTGDEVWTSMALAPVYEATVTFMVGDAVYAQRSVREGELLYDLPDSPLRDGYAFDGWSVDFAERRIGANLRVEAEFTALPTAKPEATATPASTENTQTQSKGETVSASGGKAASTRASAGSREASPEPEATDPPEALSLRALMEALLPGPPTPPDPERARQNGRFDLLDEDIPAGGIGSRSVMDCLE
ncbi:InlB B-repeat-containing protein, partial [Eubacteriales bacterium OttesenSCG-928-A19]|nr:InlB B-repeat-containing protein [Eubacteriales bacterium OttesenSCG-928-A19]